MRPQTFMIPLYKTSYYVVMIELSNVTSLIILQNLVTHSFVYLHVYFNRICSSFRLTIYGTNMVSSSFALVFGIGISILVTVS